MKMIVVNVGKNGEPTVPDSTVDAIAEHLRDMLPPGVDPRALIQDQARQETAQGTANPND
ncbi:hypothetical protein GZ998_05290 [Actinomyces sp. 594]|uniref:hypothetical protein n=1 Tax=Actinomyces sp. 594 TaxID=2057793 RepID=UPI001C568916|nr:hypothetical protein [Actinomyces sp. 594]MBW3068926.1 hypothetical protein [Actinomyces sp. 594]